MDSKYYLVFGAVICVLAVIIILILQLGLKNKETFLKGVDTVPDPLTGALSSQQGIYTNRLSRGDPFAFTKGGTFFDNDHDFNMIGGGFDESFEQQRNLQKLLDSHDQKNVKDRKVSQQEANFIAKQRPNTEACMFRRDKRSNYKLFIDENPNSYRVVMDEKYLPQRERSKRIDIVSKVVFQKGFDINPEEMGREFDGVHLSSVSSNYKAKKHPRLPSAAGATSDERVEHSEAIEKLTKDALNRKLTDSPNKLPISDVILTTANGQMGIKSPNGKSVVEIATKKPDEPYLTPFDNGVSYVRGLTSVN
jgi:hypothetical protein